jgi:hypothetical protein
MTAVINGWMVSFESYASKGEVIARFFRNQRLVGDRVWVVQVGRSPLNRPGALTRRAMPRRVF